MRLEVIFFPLKLLFIILVCSSGIRMGYAQSTKVSGKVFDASTGEVLPYASVYFKGTVIGISTDADGVFKLETRDTCSTLVAGMLGYETQTRKITHNAYNSLEFRLSPVINTLDKIVVRQRKGPLHRLLHNVVTHREKNNPEEWKSFSCGTYTKMELDLVNPIDQFKNKKLQENFGFIFKYIDTSLVNGRPFLPVMISESTADFYYRKSGSQSKEVIKASRISGVNEDYTLAQFTGQMHGNINFYDNYIDIFSIRFASPLSEIGSLQYRYFLIDSMRIGGRTTYKLRFHPRDLSTPVLDGELNIDSATYALTSVRVKLPKGSNINWLRSMEINVDYQRNTDTTWFKKKEVLSADFSLTMSDSTKMVSFLGSRIVNYNQVVRDADVSAAFEDKDDVVRVSQESMVNDTAYWNKVRPFALSEREQQIYEMVDSIKHVPLYQNIYDVLNTIFGGYYEKKYVGFGPYYKLFSYNQLEGARFQLGFRTSSELSKRWRYSGYAAYGTKDGDVKGGATVELQLKTKPTRKMTLDVKHDVSQLGASTNAFTQGNVFSSLLSRGKGDKLAMVDQGSFSYEQEWNPRISNTLTVFAAKYYDSPYVPLEEESQGLFQHLEAYKLTLNTRLSKQETVVRQTFDKYYLSSPYPIVTIDATAGYGKIPGKGFPYYRIETQLYYEPDIPPLGYSTFVLGAGKIWGTIPYPLLKLHEGNGTYFYDFNAFSTMNYLEFASDTWINLFYEHHFNGFFLGKIPLIKKLKWREVYIFKGTYGTLSDKNNGSLSAPDCGVLFPTAMRSLGTPYFESGLAVENIFKVLRLDALWRLNHRHDAAGNKIQNFALNFSFKLTF